MKLTISLLVQLAALSNVLAAQTAVDLRVQSRNIDFSSAVATRPYKMGTVLPAACNTGETFFKTDSPAGQNLYACTATNTWTVMAVVTSVNSGPGAIEVIKSQSGTIVTGRQVVTGEGSVVTQQADTVTIETDTSIVPRYASASTAPTGACQTGRDQFTRVSGFPHFYGCVGGAWKPIYAVSATAPPTCLVGELYFNQSDSGLYGCTAADQWTKFNKSGLDLTTVGECFITYSCSPTGMAARIPLPAGAVNSNVIAVRVTIPHTIRLHRGFLYTAFGSSTAAFTAAIYEDAGGVPGNKIAGTDLRFVDLSFSAYRQNVWGSGDTVLSPAIYWVGMSSQSATAEFFTANAGTGWGNFMSLLPVSPGAVRCANQTTGAGATYTLPASCGATSTLTGFADPPIIVATAQ